MSWMSGDAGQNIGEPGMRIDVVQLGRDDQTVHDRGTSAAAIGAGRTARICGPAPLPVHSAHVGQELEVYYRYHPYFGRKVLVRRIAQRATGQFLSVQGPAGIVVLIAGWMLDPVICAGMTIGAPRVDLAALVELKRLLIGLATPAHSQSDVGIVREESNEVFQISGAGAEPANETPIRQKPAGWGGTRRAEQDHLGAGSNSHAGGRPAGRGA